MIPPERQGWQSRVRGAFTQRLGLKATALVVAVLLWFVVHVVRPVIGTP
jgi:hypothetical protein